jgi:hypothetical protein
MQNSPKSGIVVTIHTSAAVVTTQAQINYARLTLSAPDLTPCSALVVYHHYESQLGRGLIIGQPAPMGRLMSAYDPERTLAGRSATWAAAIAV